jgi:ubiquitin-conjugating enzyme E2 H
MPKPNKRRILDVKHLRDIGNEVIDDKDNPGTIYTYIKGPKDTIYEKGRWMVTITLPPDYPFKSPSIGFITKIFHPNVDFESGSICLDVLNQEWSPVYNLERIVNIIIPQLLSDPNPDDPLNVKAAAMAKTQPEKFKKTVLENIEKYC